MRYVVSPAGATLSYDQYGSGPPLVLVHGSFSDHNTNWASVSPWLANQFTVYAIARRGRGETQATQDHRLEDEAGDVAALIASIEQPVFLLGHSYGAQVALAAAVKVQEHLRKLVLYEPPSPHISGKDQVARLEELAQAGDWDGFAMTFFRDTLSVPEGELKALPNSELWPSIVADAKATLGDVRALSHYPFDPDRFRELSIPVMLQIGTESPRDRFVTDALAAILPDVRIEELPGQAHEGMTTAPKLYAESVSRFLLS
jgi:pimeloyl-ACP methyl ester carboxylesterase